MDRHSTASVADNRGPCLLVLALRLAMAHSAGGCGDRVFRLLPLGRAVARQGSWPMIGRNSLKSVSNLPTWFPGPAANPRTAFPIPFRGRDNCRQSAQPRLALGGRARYISPENPDITLGEEPVRHEVGRGFWRISRGIHERPSVRLSHGGSFEDL